MKRSRSAMATSGSGARESPKRRRGMKAGTSGKSSEISAATLGLQFEERAWRDGHSVVAGVDEAGRGPLAGPVVAAAVSILRSSSLAGESDLDPPVAGVRDSKLITDESERELLYEQLIAHPRIRWGVAAVDPRGIEKINILQAAMRSMELSCLDMAGRFEPSEADASEASASATAAAAAASAPLGVYPSYVFVDGNRMPKRFKAMAECAAAREQGKPGEQGEGDGDGVAAAAAAAPASKAKSKGKGKKIAGPPEPTAPAAEYADGVGAVHSTSALRMGWEQLELDRVKRAAGSAASGEELLEPVQAAALPAGRKTALLAGPPPGFTAEMVIKGDSKVYCIAAASVIAKVTRDRIMRLIDRKYPQYDLAQHKGYPTPAHKGAVVRLGPSPVHRFCFAPIKGNFQWVPEEEREGADGQCWVRLGASKAGKTKAKDKSKGKGKGDGASASAASGPASGAGAAEAAATPSSRAARAARRAATKGT